MKTFHKILIANRGEIAVRVIRAARKSGILTVAVYSSDDAQSLHALLADEAFPLAGKTLEETYLHQEQIIHLAVDSGAQAIHPGYGFLSENAGFAQRVHQAGLVFVGPTAENIRLMGEKTQALTYVKKLGIPILSSFHGSVEQLMQHAAEMDFPVMVKASGGGGGKGMVICNAADDLPEALQTAQRQALSYFSNGELFVEKYLPEARHIEVQLMADGHGNVVHFYERECSMQRRFQKIVEEAPSPSIDESLQQELTQAAVKIARSMDYRNAGTIEFLVDERGKFYFLEMNTRIQVEHPVTEMITNSDLVALQLQVAAGNELNIEQKDILPVGHSIEMRLCAEDVNKNFLPSAGKLTVWNIPQMQNMRIETFVTEGTIVSSGYDSMLAKIIVWAETRELAIAQMQKILSESYISGIQTNISFLLALVESSDFKSNKIYTRYVDQHLESINTQVQLRKVKLDQHLVIVAWYIFHFQQRESMANSVWQQIGYWRMHNHLNISIEGSNYDCKVEQSGNDQLFRINDQEYFVSGSHFSNRVLDIQVNGKSETFYCLEVNNHTLVGFQGFLFELQSNSLLSQAKVKPRHHETSKVFQNLICAELFGKVLTINISENEEVSAGQLLLTLESMKTEIHVLCPVNAKVKKIAAKEGSNVLEKQVLVELEPIVIQNLSYL